MPIPVLVNVIIGNVPTIITGIKKDVTVCVPPKIA